MPPRSSKKSLTNNKRAHLEDDKEELIEQSQRPRKAKKTKTRQEETEEVEAEEVEQDDQEEEEEDAEAEAEAEAEVEDDDVDVEGESEGDDEDLGEEIYHGSTDESGLPHGRGTLTWSCSTQTFQGKFEHGQKTGSGRMTFADGAILKGIWKHDQVQGKALYTAPEAEFVIEGTYVDGVLEGAVKEYDYTGMLVFDGLYKENVRHGPGKLFLPDGGIYEGEFVHGEFEGKQNKYIYPAALEHEAALVGEWKSGEMKKAEFHYNHKKMGKETFHLDESTEYIISHEPLKEDPYENMCCYVKSSSLGPQANEGLFARVSLPADVVVTFYNGTREPADWAEKRPWTLNDNTIALDEEEGLDIDVAPKYIPLSAYSASKAHKCNHSIDPALRNAKYDIFMHPRFGKIKCIRTTRAVSADEELLVDYGYSLTLKCLRSLLTPHLSQVSSTPTHLTEEDVQAIAQELSIPVAKESKETDKDSDDEEEPDAAQKGMVQRRRKKETNDSSDNKKKSKNSSNSSSSTSATAVSSTSLSPDAYEDGEAPIWYLEGVSNLFKERLSSGKFNHILKKKK